MKIGFVSLPLSGHLNPMTALARKLQSRGHEIAFFGVPDVGATVSAANLTFVPFGEKEYPVGSMPETLAPLAKLSGLEAFEQTRSKMIAPVTKVALEHLPQKLAEAGIEALAIDTGHRFLELVPISLKMPFVQIWPFLHLDGSGTTPPLFFSWPHETTPQARARTLEGLRQIASLADPTKAVAKSYADKIGLQIDWNDPSATASKLAIITQTPREFDFPNIPWPSHFHYAGPFHDDDGREPVPFAWEKLSDKLLIYGSLGTLVNGLDHVYKAILQAIGQLPEFQLVLSVGNSVDPAALGPIPSNAIIVRKAPQLELLKGAALCITHAGLNTALECLAQGVPMVAVPNAYDQPGIAARITYHGVGEFLDLDKVTAERLFELIRNVMSNSSYRDKARYFQKVFAETRGLDVAADVIERAFHKSHAEPPVQELANLR